MHIFTYGRDKLHVAEETGCEDKKDPGKQYLSWLMYDFTKRKTFSSLLDAYHRFTGLSGLAVLEAHGGQENGRWQYRDGNLERSIQSWIDSIDGACLGVLVFACNPQDAEISATKSIVIHPRHSLTRIQLHQWKKPLRIFVPEAGYLEGNYGAIKRTVDEWDSLEQRLG